MIFRGNHAARFGLDDQFVEVEFYPRFRPGTYAFVAAGVAPDPTLYPEYRVAFDLYQSLGRGFEVSGGARYLDFGSVTQIYVGTLTKYIGNWMLTGKVYRVPAERDLDSTSYHGGFRYYFGTRRDQLRRGQLRPRLQPGRNSQPRRPCHAQFRYGPRRVRRAVWHTAPHLRQRRHEPPGTRGAPATVADVDLRRLLGAVLT